MLCRCSHLPGRSVPHTEGAPGEVGGEQGIHFALSPTDAAPQSCHLEEGGENGEEGGEEEEVEVSFEVRGMGETLDSRSLCM